MEKDKKTAKAIGNLAIKAGTWMHRNSMVNLVTNPNDYILAQQENVATAEKVYDKASEMNAEEWGNFTGQVVFEVGLEVATVGAASALTAVKVADKVVDGARIIDKLDDVVDGARLLENADDFIDGANVSEELGEVVFEKKKLLNNEGDIGTYKELNDAGTVGDDITPHHMPSDAYMKNNNIEGYNRNEGLSMNMEQPHPGTGGRHRRTSTYDNQMTKAEQRAYWDKNPRDALAHDIEDLRKIYKEDGLYDKEIRDKLQEYIKQMKENHPDLFNK